MMATPAHGHTVAQELSVLSLRNFRSPRCSGRRQKGTDAAAASLWTAAGRGCNQEASLVIVISAHMARTASFGASSAQLQSRRPSPSVELVTVPCFLCIQA